MQAVPGQADGYRTFGSDAGSGVAFRPAASRPLDAARLPLGTSASLGSDGLADRGGLSPRNALLVAGALALLLTVAGPIWDAAWLLDDPAFDYFVGRPLPAQTIGVCLCAVLLYAASIAAFFRFAREDFKTNHTVVMLAVVTLVALGMALLALSLPLMQASTTAYRDLFSNCQAGERTQLLARHYARLEKQRLAANCVDKESIELCEGFEETMLSGVLRDLESNYQCAGFCSGWGASWAGSQPLRSPRSRSLSAAGAAGAAPPNKFVGAAKHVTEQPVAGQAPAGHPLALFSRADSRASCEGAAGRVLKYRAVGAGQQMYWQGFILLALSTVVVAVKVGGMCILKQSPLALLAPPSGKESPDPAVRQLVF